MGILCTLFIVGFSLSFGEWWPLAAFWLLLFNRLLFILSGQAAKGTEIIALKMSWVYGILYYLLFLVPITLLPVPELGVTSDIVSNNKLPVEMLDRPQRIIAFGFLYFLSVGLTELYQRRLLTKGFRWKTWEES
ncbi:MAG: hypothetical protein V1799_10005 [bacterium]